MQPINRSILNLSSSKLTESKAFYTQLFAFEVAYDSDWFINLVSATGGIELGIIAQGHEIVPAGLTPNMGGTYLTLVVESADEVYARAQKEGYEIIAPPEDTFYGQRRLLLRDPNGYTVDVSSLIPQST